MDTKSTRVILVNEIDDLEKRNQKINDLLEQLNDELYENKVRIGELEGLVQEIDEMDGINY